MDWLTIDSQALDQIWFAARRVVGDDDAAWDCVQEAFATALATATRPKDPIAWLCGVARNHGRTWIRSDSRYRRAVERMPRAQPEREPRVEDLREALGQLPMEMRDAISLRYLAGMSIKEVAQAQSISETAAKSRIHRGLARLRATLGGPALALLLLGESKAALASGAIAAVLPATGIAKGWILGALVAICAVGFVWQSQRTGRSDGPPRRGERVTRAVEEIPDSVPPPRPSDETVRHDPEDAPSEDVPRAPMHVRDLGSGALVPGIEIAIGSDEGARRLVTDSSGAVDITGPELWNVQVATAGWKQTKRLRNSLLGMRTLWVYGSLRVEGKLRTRTGDARFDEKNTTFSAFIDDDGRRWDGPSTRHRDRVLSESSLVVESVKPDGRFVVHVPRIRGLVLAVTAADYYPVTEHLHPHMQSERATVDFTLTRAYRISGVIVDEAGAPLPGQSLFAFTIVRVSYEDVRNFERLRHLHPDGGMGACAGVNGGYAKFQRTFRSDKKGAFELDIRIAGGQTFIFGYRKGCRMIEYEVGALTGDRDDLRIVTNRAPEGSFVRITVDGKPLDREPVLVCDLDFGRGEAQPAVQLMTKADGRMPTTYLTRGRRYSIDLVEPRDGKLLGGCLRWNGEETIDLVKDVSTYQELIHGQR